MAMQLVVKPIATSEPAYIHGDGGDVKIIFTTTKAKDLMALRVTYEIAQQSHSIARIMGGAVEKLDKSAPWKTISAFANPTAGANYSQDFRIEPLGSAAAGSEALDVSIQVTGIRVDMAEMESSRDARARIVLLSAELNKLFAKAKKAAGAAGLSKKAWAEKLAKRFTNVSPGMIERATRGKAAQTPLSSSLTC